MRMTRSIFVCTTRLAPRLSCGLMEKRRAISQVRALNLKGRDNNAPTGQMSIMLPDSSDSTDWPTNVVISECSPRLIMPTSMMPPISWPKRTQRVQ